MMGVTDMMQPLIMENDKGEYYNLPHNSAEVIVELECGVCMDAVYNEVCCVKSIIDNGTRASSDIKNYLVQLGFTPSHVERSVRGDGNFKDKLVFDSPIVAWEYI